MSIKKTHLETLVNKRLDGSLTPEERQELDRMLSEDPEARRYLQEMEEMEASLRRVPKAQVPDGLPEKVISKISGTQGADSSKGSATQGGLIRHLHMQSRTMLRYAAILFVGLVLGATATVLFTEDRSMLATDEMVGSMTARTGQKLSFAQEDWQVQINPMRVDNMLILVFSAASEETLDVSLGYNTGVYRLSKSRYLSGQDTGSRIGGGSISFGVQDRVHYQLVLEEQSGLNAPFELTVSQNGRMQYNRELVFP